MLLSKATVVLFVITLKLVANNPSHHFLTHPINLSIIIWVLVLLSQFILCVMKYNVIACDNLFNTVLIFFFDNLYQGIHLYFLIVQFLSLLVHI